MPLDTGIARKVVKDLERYDLCVIERRSLLNETSILNEKLDRKDSLLKFHKSVNEDLKLIIKNKNKRIDLEKKKSDDLKQQRNLAIGGGLLGIILTALIVGN